MQYLSDIKCLISSHGSILALFAFFVSINSSPVNASSNHSLEGLKPHTMEGLWWKHSGFEHWLLCVKIVRKVAFAVLTCTFALCKTSLSVSYSLFPQLNNISHVYLQM